MRARINSWTYVDSTCVQVATLLEAEYPPGEAQRAGLTPPGELAALLDALC